MRLWHKFLIKALPREQLVAQWRECSAIAGNILTKGNPNHLLVNKIMDFPLQHFISYSYYVREEMTKRGYKTMDKVWDKICSVTLELDKNILPINEIFPQWHNDTYWIICYYNLKEKWLCGGIKEEDWNKIDILDSERKI